MIRNSAIFLIFLFIASCTRDLGRKPLADFIISCQMADTTTIFTVDASPSQDAESPSFSLKVRWDWENDGQWDSEFSLLKQSAHRFCTAGCYTISLEVKDQDGNCDTTSQTLLVIDLIGKDSIIVDNRDQQQYRVVLINDLWWMSQNLNFGQWIKSFEKPHAEYTNKYYLHDDSLNGINYGGLYTWNELFPMGYGKGIQDICPEGWSLPTKQQFYKLYYLTDYHFSNAYPLIGKGGLLKTDFEQSGLFNLRGTGDFSTTTTRFWLRDSIHEGPTGNFSELYPGNYAFRTRLSLGLDEPHLVNFKTAAFHIRCVKSFKL
jgi:uncharacterized protein (TIGR02145 family)